MALLRRLRRGGGRGRCGGAFGGRGGRGGCAPFSWSGGRGGCAAVSWSGGWARARAGFAAQFRGERREAHIAAGNVAGQRTGCLDLLIGKLGVLRGPQEQAIRILLDDFGDLGRIL